MSLKLDHVQSKRGACPVKKRGTGTNFRKPYVHSKSHTVSLILARLGENVPPDNFWWKFKIGLCWVKIWVTWTNLGKI